MRETMRAQLQTYTQITVGEKALPAESLILEAKSKNISALAITDKGKVTAHFEVYDAAKKLEGAGIKVIYGVEVKLVDGLEDEYGWRSILLICNECGRVNLNRLLTEADRDKDEFEKQSGVKRRELPVMKKLLKKYREGLLVGAVCEGKMWENLCDRKTPVDQIEAQLRFYDYLQIGDNSDIGKRIYEEGERRNKLVVASGDTLRLQTIEALLEKYDYLGCEDAYKVVVENPNKVASMVEEVCPIQQKKQYVEIENACRRLRDMCYQTAEEEYGEILPTEVNERVAKELELIERNGYSSLYVLVADVFRKAGFQPHQISTGTMVGNSVVAYLLGLTDINPLPEHGICRECKWCEFESNRGKRCCPVCGGELERRGHDLDYRLFMKPDGSKAPYFHFFVNNTDKEKVKAVLELHPQINCVIESGAVGPRENGKIKGEKARFGKFPHAFFIVPCGTNICEYSPFHRNDYGELVTQLELHRRKECGLFRIDLVDEGERNECVVFSATQDEVFEQLCAHGIHDEQAYQIMEHVSRGNVLTEGEKKLMRNSGFLEEEIQEYDIPCFRFSRAHLITEMKAR